MILERLYIVKHKRLKELLAAEAKLKALERGGVDNWINYEMAINDYLDIYTYNIKDIIYTWDDDDPRRKEFDFNDVVDLELQSDEFKRIDLEI